MRASPSPTTGRPARRPRRWRVGRLGHARDRPRRRRRRSGRAAGRTSRWRRGNGRPSASSPRAPGLGQRAGQVVLLGQDVGGPVAHAAGLDAAAPGRRRGAGRSGGARRAVSHGSHDSMPSKTRPSLSRSHCSRPHGSSPTSSAARARTSSVASSSRPGKISTSSRSTVERWSLTENSLSRSTSSPHRSMRTGASAVDGNTSTIEPRHGHLAPVLDQVLAAVAHADELGDEVVGIEHAALGDDDRLDVVDVGAEPLQRAPAPSATTTRGRPVGVAQAPQDLQPAAHGLDRRAHPLERQRLPGREQLDRVGAEERPRSSASARRRCRWARPPRSGGGPTGGPAPPR